ncbi:MAG: metallophosphoesterase [Lachnospiraceae bacterium]|nr:metallophosphoesterase [Lachnospiraceae bacterium]
MKILVLADEESKVLYDYYKPGMLDDIDLILACGDLKAGYLSFLLTMSHAPVVYVSGNHDHYNNSSMQGCICVEDDIFVYKGVRILGLGGSMRYHPDSENQYTEREMRARIRRLRWKLFRHRGFDILMTHAPAYQLNDMEDLPHQGFQCFLKLIERYNPKYFVHGHVHANYGSRFKRLDHYKDTTVVNAYEKYIIEYPD